MGIKPKVDRNDGYKQHKEDRCGEKRKGKGKGKKKK